jgi:hypothetical protein
LSPFYSRGSHPPVSPLFSPCSDSRVGSAPFPLFPRVILTPVFSRAYSGPTALFNLAHSVEITNRVATLFFGNRGAKFPKIFQKKRTKPRMGTSLRRLRSIAATWKFSGPTCGVPGQAALTEPRQSAPRARDAFESERFDRFALNVRNSFIY